MNRFTPNFGGRGKKRSVIGRLDEQFNDNNDQNAQSPIRNNNNNRGGNKNNRQGRNDRNNRNDRDIPIQTDRYAGIRNRGQSGQGKRGGVTSRNGQNSGNNNQTGNNHNNNNSAVPQQNSQENKICTRLRSLLLLFAGIGSLVFLFNNFDSIVNVSIPSFSFYGNTNEIDWFCDTGEDTVGGDKRNDKGIACYQCPKHNVESCKNGRVYCKDHYIQSGKRCVLDEKRVRLAEQINIIAGDVLAVYKGRVDCGENIDHGLVGQALKPQVQQQMSYKNQQEFDDGWDFFKDNVAKDSSLFEVKYDRNGKAKYYGNFSNRNFICKIKFFLWDHIVACITCIGFLVIVGNSVYSFKEKQNIEKIAFKMIDYTIETLYELRQRGIKFKGVAEIRQENMNHFGHLFGSNPETKEKVWTKVEELVDVSEHIKKQTRSINSVQQPAWAVSETYTPSNNNKSKSRTNNNNINTNINNNINNNNTNPSNPYVPPQISPMQQQVHHHQRLQQQPVPPIQPIRHQQRQQPQPRGQPLGYQQQQTQYGQNHNIYPNQNINNGVNNQNPHVGNGQNDSQGNGWFGMLGNMRRNMTPLFGGRTQSRINQPGRQFQAQAQAQVTSNVYAVPIGNNNNNPHSARVNNLDLRSESPAEEKKFPVYSRM